MRIDPVGRSSAKARDESMGLGRDGRTTRGASSDVGREASGALRVAAGACVVPAVFLPVVRRVVVRVAARDRRGSAPRRRRARCAASQLLDGRAARRAGWSCPRRRRTPRRSPCWPAIEASVTAITGGVSMIDPVEVLASVARKSSKRFEPSSSAGFGGIMPGRQHPEARHGRLADRLARLAVADQQVREPGLLRDARRSRARAAAACRRRRAARAGRPARATSPGCSRPGSCLRRAGAGHDERCARPPRPTRTARWCGRLRNASAKFGGTPL